MNELIIKIREIYKLITIQKLDLDKREAELAETAAKQDTRQAAQDTRQAELDNREAKIKSAEELAALNEETKKLNLDTQARLIALKTEETAFLKYRSDELALTAADRARVTEQIASNKNKEVELDDKLARLEEDRKNLKQDILAAIAEGMKNG